MKIKQSSRGMLKQVVCALALVNLMIFAATPGARAMDPSKPVKIVAFGDSLTAGYMLPPSESFPAQLAARLKAKGLAAEVANAGVSGDTSGAGLERLDWSIPPGTEAVILELGANDALRGIEPERTREILDRILTRLKARNIEVLVAGMLAPKNWGADYEREFNAMFGELAEKHGALLYPFFLDGVAMDPTLTMADGLHPTGAGVGVIADRILPKVEALMQRVEAHRSAHTATP